MHGAASPGDAGQREARQGIFINKSSGEASSGDACLGAVRRGKVHKSKIMAGLGMDWQGWPVRGEVRFGKVFKFTGGLNDDCN